MTKALQTKFDKIKSLITEFNQTLDREAEIDVRADSGDFSPSVIRDFRDDLRYDQKKIEEAIGKVWATLSGNQQVHIYNLIEKSDQWLLDGF